MKTLKKLTLNKEEIMNLNDFEMRNLKGGTGTVTATLPEAAAAAAAASSTVCNFVAGYLTSKVADYAVDAVEDYLKSNTAWVGCTTGEVTYYGGTLSEVTVYGTKP